MSTSFITGFVTVTPTAAESVLAGESIRRLASFHPTDHQISKIQVLDDESAEVIDVPSSALRLFVQLLSELSEGNSVSLIPVHAELTTQQAAELLNVSRPYIVKLLDEGKIPSRTVGKFRRVRLDDLMAYKKKDDDARSAVLDQLTAEAQDSGMGY